MAPRSMDIWLRTRTPFCFIHMMIHLGSECGPIGLAQSARRECNPRYSITLVLQSVCTDEGRRGVSL